MNKLLGTVALSALLAAPAMAADMPVKARPAPVVAAVYDWSGIYVGGSVGYGWGDVDWIYHDPTGVVADRPINNNPARVNGVFGGGHVGIQRQWGNWVLGVEFNGLGSAIDGSELCFNVAFRCHMEITTIWTVGPRLGFARDNLLFYATGGFASGRIKTHENAVAGGPDIFATSAWHHGWMIGGGLEWGFTPNFIAGIEYMHVDLNRKFQQSTTNTEHRNIKGDADLVRLRLTYKFNPWGPVVARY